MGVVGHLTGRQLATGGYRIDEDEAEHAPGRNWWPGLATAALAGLAAWSVGDLGGWAALPAYLLFAWLTVGAGLDRPRRAPAARGPGRADRVVAGRAARGGLGRDRDRRWLGAVVGAAGDGGGLPPARGAARRGSRRRRRAARAGHRGAARLAGRRRARRGAAGRVPRRAAWPPWRCSCCAGWGCAAPSPTAPRCAWGRGWPSASTSRILTWLAGRLRAAWKDSPHAALADRRGVARARARRDHRRAARGGRGDHAPTSPPPSPAAGWATAAAPG